MIEQKYKRLSRVFIITLILFFIAFFADIYLLFIKDNFQPDFVFAFFTIIAVLSYLAFMRYLIWTLFNKEGKEFWRVFIEQNGLKDVAVFKANEPAHIIRTWLLAVAVAAVAIILIIVL